MRASKYSEQLQSRVTPEIKILLDRYMKKNNYTESQAVRMLVAKGLVEEKTCPANR